MPISKFAGKAQTVLGLIEGGALGITLPHEHLVLDNRVSFIESREASEKALAYMPVNLETISWLHYNPHKNLDNCQLFDEQEAIDEAMLFKKAGGGTIVDLTNIGFGRDPRALARISRATGLNVIMGTGYYLAASHPADMSAKTEEEITEEIVRDITIGVDDTGIRAGIIGEAGCSWPMHENERKSVRASARAQQQTGAPINIHPGRLNNQSALEVLEILADASADLSRVVMSHMETRIRDENVRCEVAAAGCYIEYDNFGWEGHLPLATFKDTSVDLPNDTQRVYEIMSLINKGYLNKILISQDIGFKSWRVRYGGRGYIHISKYVVPMMLAKGMTQEQINTIMIENPKRLLCFV